MKIISKSEWFEFPTPIGEPDYKWDYDYGYSIERLLKEDGSIVWYGLAINWLKEKGGVWTVLGVDESVEPIEIYYNDDGSIGGGLYPEGRDIWIPCNEPIYEQEYKKLNYNIKNKSYDK